MPLIQASEPIEVYPALKTQLASASASFMGFISERETALKWEGYNTEMNGLMVLLQIAGVCVKKGCNVGKVMFLLYRRINKQTAIKWGTWIVKYDSLFILLLCF